MTVRFKPKQFALNQAIQISLNRCLLVTDK